MKRPPIPAWFPMLLLGVLLAAPATSRAGGVRVAVFPESLTTAPGDTFTVQVQVPVAGDAFNGYDAVLAFDPAALRFVPRQQSDQEGALLRGACGNTFYGFCAAGDSLSVTDILLCNQVFLPGPGTLLNLKFVALQASGTTFVRLRNVVFYNAGRYVTPVVPSDAAITVASVLAVPVPAPAPEVPRLLAAPNPSRGTAWLRAGAPPGTCGEIRICDAAGRIVRRLALEPGQPSRPVAWDGRGDDGRAAPPGVYAALLRTPDRVLHTLLVRLP